MAEAAGVAGAPGIGEPGRGRILDGRHVFPVRVYYEDTDAGGIVYYANYLKFAERARTELLRLVGIDQARLAAETGLVFAVRRCAADYRKPARLDDVIEVVTTLAERGRARLTLAQAVRRGAEALVSLDVQIACLDRDLRPARLPEAVRRALDRLDTSSGGSGAGGSGPGGSGPGDKTTTTGR